MCARIFTKRHRDQAFYQECFVPTTAVLTSVYPAARLILTYVSTTNILLDTADELNIHCPLLSVKHFNMYHHQVRVCDSTYRCKTRNADIIRRDTRDFGNDHSIYDLHSTHTGVTSKITQIFNRTETKVLHTCFSLVKSFFARPRVMVITVSCVGLAVGLAGAGAGAGAGLRSTASSLQSNPIALASEVRR